MPVKVLLVTTNGTGMGHLARMTAVALAGQDSLQPTILTFSTAAALTSNLGVPVEYCPSRERGWHSHWLWDDYMQHRLVSLVKELRAEVVIFDGVVPYDGLIAASTELPQVRFLWSRRGMWKPNAPRWPIRRARWFDAIIEPGDLASAADSGPTTQSDDALRIPPITLVTQTSMLNQRAARAALGLPDAGSLLYVSVGSFIRADIELLNVIDDVAKRHRYTIVTAGAVDGGAARGWLTFEKRFPLAQELQAFDAVVCAAGYNNVHENLAAAIPTLLLPNAETMTDDQITRAQECAQSGLALTAPAHDHVAIAQQLTKLLTSFTPLRVESPLDGATAMVSEIVSLTQRPVSRKLRARKISFKRTLLRTLGPIIGPFLRRIMGRKPARGPRSRLNLGLGEGAWNVRWTEDVQDAGNLEPRTLVEHVLPGTSSVYAQARRSIAAKYYLPRM